MQLLTSNMFSDIIDWLPHGQSFIIFDRKKFTQYVLPCYFTETKYTSFTRKLLRWGFIRMRKGVETGAYKHEVSFLFVHI